MIARIIGVIAQLGERYNGIVEVGGSIPPGSTIFVNKLKLIVQYIWALALFFPALCGLFCADTFGIYGSNLDVYIKMASIFLCAIAFMLCWYVANLIIRREVLRRAYDLGISMLDVDFAKISQNNLQTLVRKISQQFEKYEACRFEFLGYCLPFLTIFLILLITSVYKKPDVILTYLFSCSIVFVLVKLAYLIVGTCSMLERNMFLKDSLSKLAFSARGIQFYGSIKFIKSKLRCAKMSFIKAAKKQVTYAVWRSFYYICVTFFIVVILYISNKEYIILNLFNLNGIYEIYIANMFVFILFLIKFFHWQNDREQEIDNLEKYRLKEKKESQAHKEIDIKNLFIAFHGVYFQDPAMLSQGFVIRDLTFSILPGEFVVVTGENIKKMRYIFDLLLRFYSPQSGQIYLSGTKIENISKEQLRSLIGVFEEDFGLIDGTVQENLEMVSDDVDAILSVSENIGLSEFLQMDIYHSSGQIQLSQKILFKLQMARLTLQRPEIMLIQTPQSFETEENERIFYDFLNYSIKKRTVILITETVSSIIYAHKILFLTENCCLFGTHAELSKNADYQNCIKKH